MKVAPVILVAALSVGACRSSDKVVDYQSVTDYGSVSKIAKSDSSVVHFHLQIDSPKILIEYLDTPRRRIVFEAVRAETRSESLQHSEIDSVAAIKVDKTETRKSHSHASPFSPVLPYMAVIILFVSLIFMCKRNKNLK